MVKKAEWRRNQLWLSVTAGNNGKKAGSQENMTNENVDVDRAARWERQQLDRDRFAQAWE